MGLPPLAAPCAALQLAALQLAALFAAPRNSRATGPPQSLGCSPYAAAPSNVLTQPTHCGVSGSEG